VIVPVLSQHRCRDDSQAKRRSSDEFRRPFHRLSFGPIESGPRGPSNGKPCASGGKPLFPQLATPLPRPDGPQRPLSGLTTRSVRHDQTDERLRC
jgi:hypothetical protein